MSNDRRRSRFRNKGHTHDNEICVRPTSSDLRMGILARHATTEDGDERSHRAGM